MNGDRVEIRWLKPAELRPDQWARLEGLLDGDERATADRLRQEDDRRAYVAAHGLVRVMLSAAHPPVPPAAWRFTATPFGKPEISGPARPPALTFSLSHTRGLVACAVTLDHPVGLDVEAVDATLPAPQLAADHFSPTEQATLAPLAGAALTEAFFGIWTLKEAFLKAKGVGLSLPTNSFSVSLDPPDLAGSAENNQCWLLRRFQPTPFHAAALALHHPLPALASVRERFVGAKELDG